MVAVDRSGALEIAVPDENAPNWHLYYDNELFPMLRGTNILTALRAEVPEAERSATEAPTVSSSLNLHVRPGRVPFSDGTVFDYPGGTIALTASALNYVYFDDAGTLTKSVVGWPAGVNIYRVAKAVTDATKIILPILDERLPGGFAGADADAAAAGLDPKGSVRVASVANVPLTGGAALTIDGVSIINGDRILLKDQTTGSQNGLYYPTGIGTAYTLTRTPDADDDEEVTTGLYTTVEEGTVNAGRAYYLVTTMPITLGTTTLVFSVYGSKGAPHGGLTGLVASDDHTQYALLAGRTGGQTMNGGLAASIPLRLNSTAHATKGKVEFNGANLYAEADNCFVAPGGVKGAVRTITAAETMTDADSLVLADTTAAAFTVTLPTPVGRTGKAFVVKQINHANAVTVATAVGTIDGAATKVYAAQNETHSYVSDGSNWWIGSN